MRIALGIEYDGYSYAGWQKQPGLLTVQSCLEKALASIADHEIKVFCAGRTDAGVHGVGQVVHFDTEVMRIPRAWVIGTNTHLPKSITVRWVETVANEFHARFSAISRTYQYVIYNTPIRSALLAGRATWYPYQLDVKRMQEAAHYLVGEHDFTSFRSSVCESKSPNRNVHWIEVTRNNQLIFIKIQANAFLHHMVRNIAGTLIAIGNGAHEPDWAAAVLQAKDRRAAAETAPPHGLYLYQVGYPPHYQFPVPFLPIFG